MTLVHISDTHGAKYHEQLTIPECDVLIHSGDIGGRTNIKELMEFLIWFEKQPAKKKIFVAGNHDIILDIDFANKQTDSVVKMLMRNHYVTAKELIGNYDVVYLQNKDYVYEGIKFWGSPYSPSFHREYWAFNADRGPEIKKIWDQIPSDVDVVITHGPVYGILDEVEDRYLNPGEDKNKGCEYLLNRINTKLTKLKLHCSGHIHENYGIIQKSVSRSRRCLFSNGAVLTNQYEFLIKKPLIIEI